MSLITTIFAFLTALAILIVIHELGHVFGLGHTTARGVMQGPNPGNPQQSYSEPPLTDFTEQEKLVMKLMLQRPAMNRWPDNDRGITQISSCSNTTAPCVFCPKDAGVSGSWHTTPR